jgi:hypothetical protein
MGDRKKYLAELLGTFVPYSSEREAQQVQESISGFPELHWPLERAPIIELL